MLETLAGDGGRARLTGQRERDRAIAALIRRRECISAAIAACAADPDRAASVCDARRLRVGGARRPRRRDRGLLLPLLLALPLRLTLLEQRLGIGRRRRFMPGPRRRREEQGCDNERFLHGAFPRSTKTYSAARSVIDDGTGFTWIPTDSTTVTVPVNVFVAMLEGAPHMLR